jgi:molybdopterin/thiamine biosynthesis adenylyltransferase
MTQSCADAGVLGVLPGVIGLLQAVETIKLLLGQGEPLFGRLLVYDALAGTFRELKVRRDPRCAYCADGRAFPGYIDYAGFCGGR